jgi:DNA repair protein RadD
MIVPRDYQGIAANAIWDYFYTHTGNPVCVMPTGVGKSIVIAMLCWRILTTFPGQRIMSLTHVKELIEQNAKKMLEVWPNAPVGVYSAGLKSRQTYMPITFGGVQSVVPVIGEFGHIDILIIDECHLVSPDAESSYQFIIAELKKVNPYLKVVGLTATDYRIGQGRLTDEGGIFTDVCINMSDMASFNWFIDQGYLVKLIPRRTDTFVDVTDVSITNGDYSKGELETATDKVTYGALKEAIEHAADRKSWVVFCAGNENAERASAILNSFGISSTFVHSGVKNTKKDPQRDLRIQGYKEGHFRAICNNNILTTGFDHPAMDCIIVLRKTMSPGLWVQMLGRGTRPVYYPGYDLSTREGRLAAIYYGGKPNCLVLDFARNTRDLGPINDPVIPKRKGVGGGDVPTKICPKCGTYNHTSVRFCDWCGEEFEFQVGFTAKAGYDELLVSDAPVFEWFNVSTIIYRKHLAKNSQIPMLKVTYRCQIDRYQSKFFDEYLGFEHPGGLVQHKAHGWWRARHNTEPPATVDEALELQPELRKPKKIRVWSNRRYPEIMNYEYE